MEFRLDAKGRVADIMKTAGEAIGSINQEEGHHKFDEKQIDEFCTLSTLDSLRFEAFNFRETAIPEAYQRTFEWVFQDSESTPRDARCDDFDTWLQAPQGDRHLLDHLKTGCWKIDTHEVYHSPSDYEKTA